jgi:formiminotetrahydrofolate cyclodeaminase
MADKVQYHLEKMIPEFKELKESQEFEAQEVSTIIKRITDFEYKVTSNLEKDIKSYIKFTVALWKLVSKRIGWDC